MFETSKCHTSKLEKNISWCVESKTLNEKVWSRNFTNSIAYVCVLPLKWLSTRHKHTKHLCKCQSQDHWMVWSQLEPSCEKKLLPPSSFNCIGWCFPLQINGVSKWFSLHEVGWSATLPQRPECECVGGKELKSHTYMGRGESIYKGITLCRSMPN